MHGSHIFNPSNIALVIVFLVLGPKHVEPLDFWWGPVSSGVVLALCVIVVGAVLILSQLRMLRVALAFLVPFAAVLAVVAVLGHCMTAHWHVGALCGAAFWWVLVASPEVFVFACFMITDPKTTPKTDPTASRTGWQSACSPRCSSRRNAPSTPRRWRCSRRWWWCPRRAR